MPIYRHKSGLLLSTLCPLLVFVAHFLFFPVSCLFLLFWFVLGRGSWLIAPPCPSALLPYSLVQTDVLVFRFNCPWLALKKTLNCSRTELPISLARVRRKRAKFGSTMAAQFEETSMTTAFNFFLAVTMPVSQSKIFCPFSLRFVADIIAEFWIWSNRFSISMLFVCCCFL